MMRQNRDPSQAAARDEGRLSPRSRLIGRLPRSEHDLRLLTACLLWIVATTTLLAASFVPPLAPDEVWAWRIGFGLSAYGFAFFHVTVLKRMDDRAQERWLLASAVFAVAGNLIVMQLTPATWAVAMNMMGSVVWAAFFLRGRAVLIAGTAATAVAASPLVVSGGEWGPADDARLVTFVPVLWALMGALYAQKRTMDAAQRKATEMALRDPLTATANLRALREYFDALARKSDSAGFALLLIDIDGFKAVNAMYGNLGGDHVLRGVATQLRMAAGGRHLVSRIGGDQFVVVARGAGAAESTELADLYRQVVVGADTEHGLEGVRLDASVGVAHFPHDGQTLDDVLTAAERSMYAEKAGRSRLAAKPATISVKQPSWLAATVDPPPPPDTRWRAVWLSRPLFARMTAAYWFTSAIVMFAGYSIDGVRVKYSAIFLFSCVSAVGWSAALFAVRVRHGGVFHRFLDGFSLLGLSGMTYLSGGTQSFVMPLVPLFIVHQAWFWSVRSAWWRLLATWAVILSPLLYDEALRGEGSELAAAFLFTSITFTGGLALMLAISASVLLGVRDATRRLALEDPLTGIANRRAFADYVERRLDVPPEASLEPFGLVVLDLDAFKQVNKQQGHRAGDALLTEVAAALAAAVGDEAMIARTGGDEFVVVVESGDEPTVAARSKHLATVVDETCSSRLLHDGVAIKASCGIALCPADGRTLDELMRHADAGMMRIKRSRISRPADGTVLER